MPVFTKLTPEQLNTLLQTQNSARVYLSPKEKFDKLVKEISKKTKRRIRFFHFKAIEHCGKIYLFTGLGIEVAQFENDFHGKRLARVFAVEMFTNAPIEKRGGGYTFDFLE
jgi:hypothetical protein